MAKEWIDKLARDIKQKNREAAEDYGREQHYAGIVSTSGKEFFVALVICLQENVNALRSRLQGAPVASETEVQTIKADEAKITRARFPWVDAQLIHRGDTITLDYAKGPGLQGDPAVDRKTSAFVFKVAADDTMFVQEAFAGRPHRYEQPEELARHITEILFSV
jgi:hypothetical protein